MFTLSHTDSLPICANSTSVAESEQNDRLLAVTSGSAAKGSAKGLDAIGSGPVHCHFPHFPLFPTMHV